MMIAFIIIFGLIAGVALTVLINGFRKDKNQERKKAKTKQNK